MQVENVGPNGLLIRFCRVTDVQDSLKLYPFHFPSGPIQSRKRCLARRANTLLMCAFSVFVLVGIVSLAVDLGRVQLARAEMFSSAENVARYASAGLVDGTVASRVATSLNDNECLGQNAGITAADYETGIWDPSSRTFTPTSLHPDAVRVTAQRSQARSNAMPLVFGPSIGVSQCDLCASAIAYRNMNVMLVVGNTSLSAADQLARNRLETLGFHVVVCADTAVTANSAKYMRAVVISETVVSSNVNTKLKAAAIPVVCYEPFLVDDFQMAGGVSGVDYGLSLIASRISITNSSHALANGLSGTVTVSSVLDGSTDAFLAWARIGTGGVQIASIPGTVSYSAVYAFETGATLVDGSAAPARRVGFFGSGPLGGFVNGVPATTWTSGGWTVFDNAVRWAAGPDPQISTVRLSP